MHEQGYGLTETCAASFIALPAQDNSGTVGPPTCCAYPERPSTHSCSAEAFTLFAHFSNYCDSN